MIAATVIQRRRRFLRRSTPLRRRSRPIRDAVMVNLFYLRFDHRPHLAQSCFSVPAAWFAANGSEDGESSTCDMGDITRGLTSRAAASAAAISVTGARLVRYGADPHLRFDCRTKFARMLRGRRRRSLVHRVLTVRSRWFFEAAIRGAVSAVLTVTLFFRWSVCRFVGLAGGRRISTAFSPA